MAFQGTACEGVIARRFMHPKPDGATGGSWGIGVNPSNLANLLAAAGGMHCTLFTQASKGLKPSERFAGSHHRKVQPIVCCNFTAPSRRRGERGAESKPHLRLVSCTISRPKSRQLRFLPQRRDLNFEPQVRAQRGWAVDLKPERRT